VLRPVYITVIKLSNKVGWYRVNTLLGVGVFYFWEVIMLENIYLRVFVEYVIVFISVFILTYILFIRKNKKYNKNNVPIELLYLVKLYDLNIKKINYKKFVWIYSLINTFIISTVYILITYLLESLILQIIVGIVLLILFIIICYGLLGRYYMMKEGDKNV